MELSNKELILVTGGSKVVKYGLFIAIGGLISFAVGIIDGYLRPLSCNK